MSRLERLTVQVAPDVRAEIERASDEQECSIATVMRQALRDWTLRRARPCRHMGRLVARSV
jgi:hypothetical protein